MAKKAKIGGAGATRPNTPEKRAKEMKDLVNRGVALQIELLGAAVQVWSTMFESLAAYTKTTSEEILGVSGGGDANAALDKVMAAAREKLDTLTDLPDEIASGFAGRVRARAKR
jgi:hypothetical protein